MLSKCSSDLANLQQQRAQMVFVDDPLTRRGHVCLLDIIIAT